MPTPILHSQFFVFPGTASGCFKKFKDCHEFSSLKSISLAKKQALEQFRYFSEQGREPNLCTRKFSTGHLKISAARESPGGKIMREVLDIGGRKKLDRASDRDFYEFPRMVKHVDDKFLESLTTLYRQRLPIGGRILDLMSSWVSHLPPEIEYETVVGHGMNAAELMRNKRLTQFFIKDLNEDQTFECEDSTFDAVICTVSVQYLQQPERVFAEVYRILKPGGVCIISFSNRMFYDKAIAAWRDLNGYGRVQLVKQYFLSVSGFTAPEVITEVEQPITVKAGWQTPKLFDQLIQIFMKAPSDPFFAVISYRNFKPIN